MTITQQRHKHWCAHACIESASMDQRGQQIWTQELIEAQFNQLFPLPERVLQSVLLPSICFTTGLGNTFHLGNNKDTAFKYKDKLNEVIIFVITQKNEQGGV